MNFLVLIGSVLLTSVAFAGGSTGGNPGVFNEELMQLAFSSESLPKLYASDADFQRAQARLSVKDCQAVELSADGHTIQVRKVLKSIVTVDGSKEVLPASTVR